MSRYGFVASASRPEVAKGKVAYSARMRHMDVIRGVWLEDEGGNRVAKAKVLSVDGTRLEFIINEDVPVGRYRLFIGSRTKGQTAVATDSVPVEIVAEP